MHGPRLGKEWTSLYKFWATTYAQSQQLFKALGLYAVSLTSFKLKELKDIFSILSTLLSIFCYEPYHTLFENKFQSIQSI